MTVRSCCDCGDGAGLPNAGDCAAGVTMPVTSVTVSVSAGPSVQLTTLRPGQTALVSSTTLEPGDAALLRAMGLRMSARIRLCRLGEPCIVEVLTGSESCGRKGGCACRIGLARPLAERVMVGSVEGG